MTRPTWHRVQPPALMRAVYPGNRAWQRDVHDGHLSVFVGREPHTDGPVWHLSISHRACDTLQPGRYPTWDEIVEARERFIPDEVTVAMLLPPRAEWVNVHETTFHLWEVDQGRRLPSVGGGSSVAPA